MSDSLRVDESLVVVEWIDSAITDGWVFHNDMRKSPHRCVSIGWMIRSDKFGVTLVPHLAENDVGAFDQGLGCLTIPRRAITRVRNLSNPWGKKRGRNGGA